MKGKKIFLYISVLILFLIYFSAGIIKILTPLQFYGAVKSYEIIKEPFAIAIISTVVPFLEVFSAIFLLIPTWRKSSSLLILVLTLIFLFAILSAYLRGINMDCGCFGGVLVGETGLSSIIRNIFLTILSAFVLVKSD